MSTMSLQEKLSSFVVKTEGGSIPEGALKVAKQSILDYFAVALAGSTQPIGALMKSYLEKFGCKGPATIIGFGVKAPCSSAALVNGILGHALDFDDSNPSLLGHPTTPVASAALPVAELADCSGEELLAAFAVGVEVECKMGLALNPTHSRRGWHCTSTIGVFGATAAAGRLLGLDEEQMTHAFGIAASLSSGIRGNFGAMTKPLHAGRAAENGVVAATLAGEGFTSNRSVLEASFGFFKVTTGGYDAKALDKLGDPWDLVNPGIFYKLYPCCHYSHGAINAVLSLRKEEGLRPEDVEEIEVRATRAIYDNMIYHEPKTGLEGKFSMEYVVSVAMLDGNVKIEHFTDEKVRDPRAVEFMGKVNFHVDPEVDGLVPYELGAAIVRVKVKTKDGKVLSRDGMPTAGLEELKGKFAVCAGYVLPEEKADKLMSLVLELEKVSSIRELMELTY
nr:MmgE/PrpD family protein [Candidatus Freyrarchaeum guaymaensis]